MARWKKIITAREACVEMGICDQLLRRLETLGLLVAYRTPGGHRRYSKADIEAYLEKAKGEEVRKDGKGNGTVVLA